MLKNLTVQILCVHEAIECYSCYNEELSQSKKICEVEHELPDRWKSSVDDAVDSDPGVEIPAAPESAGLCPVSSLVDGTLRYLAISTFTGTCMPLSWDLLSDTDVDAFSHLKQSVEK